MAVSGNFDLIAFLGQEASDVVAQVGVVIGDKNATAGGLRKRRRLLRNADGRPGSEQRVGRAGWQPAERLLDERTDPCRRHDTLFPSLDPISRQMSGAERNRDGENRAAAHSAFNRNSASVLPDKLGDEREADAGTLKTAPVGAFDAMEALEKLGQFAVRNANTRVAHDKLRVPLGFAQGDGNFAFPE